LNILIIGKLDYNYYMMDIKENIIIMIRWHKKLLLGIWKNILVNILIFYWLLLGIILECNNKTKIIILIIAIIIVYIVHNPNYGINK
jgi:hypothetical protein